MDMISGDIVAEKPDAAEAIRIAAVELAVRNLGATTRFYRDAIGLRVMSETRDTVVLGAGDAPFLRLTPSPHALPDDPRAAGLFHTAFLLPARADLADWLAHAGASGVVIDGASDHAVSEAIYLTDPEGNGVEIYADRDRAAWRWQLGQVRMTTERLDIQGLLAAKSGPGWRGAPDGARIGHVHLRVGDVADAVTFWTGVIGLELVAARPGAAFLSSGRYHHHIGVNVWQSAGAGPRDPRRAGLVAVTLEVSSPHAPTRDPWGTEIRFVSTGEAAAGEMAATPRL